MVGTIQIGLSGLQSSIQKLNVTASNIANVTTAGSLEDGQQPPYSALTTTSESLRNGGVRTDIVPRNPGFVPAFSPDSPFANEDGIIGVPNVNLAEEAVNLLLAETTYKANIATIKTAEDMSDELLSIFDDDA